MIRFGAILLLCLIVVSGGDSSLNNWSGSTFPGFKANLLEYPFTVGISTQPTVYSSFCGGAILTERSIVTAASCFDNISPDATLYFHTAKNPNLHLRIDNVFKHYCYSNITLNGDVAILRTSEPIEFDGEIWPIQMPPISYKIKGKMGSQLALNFTTMSYVNAKALTTEDCLKSWNITYNQMCVAGPKDKCMGFTHGFPYVQRDIDGMWLLTGIASFTDENCIKPSVVTKLKYFGLWFSTTVDKEQGPTIKILEENVLPVGC